MPEAGGLLGGLALIIVLGITAQWLAWRLRLPSILLLLLFGFVAGPVSGAIRPGEILGGLLLPIVSISVALILFEGGLSLRFRDLRQVGAVVRNMVTVGALVTWLLAALAARLFLVDGDGGALSWQMAILLGAILSVTGPTVIIPLLRHVRPADRLESILRWEGIVIDPIGATIAVLVFQAVVAIHEGRFETGAPAVELLKTVAIGGGVGLAGAGVLYVMLKRYLIPDFLHNATTLMAVVGVFSLANLLQHESGIFAVTVMGIGLANQRTVAVKHIAEFKENLQILLISIVFIVLSANLELDHLSRLNAGTFLFLGALILVVRPLMVVVSTAGSPLNWRDKAFLSMMAPRGIVAAAVASVFSIHLGERGIAQAELLLPFTFIVIIATVAFYGLGAPLVARWLGLAVPNPQGTVIVGAHPWARAIAAALKSVDCRVLLTDINRANLQAARMDGLPTYYGSALTEHALEEIDLDGMGRLLALTPNHEVNSLAALHFREVFSSADTYQLPPATVQKATEGVPKHMRGRYLFGDEAHFDAIEGRWLAGARVKVTRLTEEFDFEKFTSHYGETALPLFVVSESGKVTVVTRTTDIAPVAGDRLISLAVEPPEERDAGPGEGDEAAGEPEGP